MKQIWYQAKGIFTTGAPPKYLIPRKNSLFFKHGVFQLVVPIFSAKMKSSLQPNRPTVSRYSQSKFFVGIFFIDTENGEEQIKRVGGCLTRLSSKNESKMQKYSLAFRKLPRVDAMTLPIGLPAGSLSPVEIGPNPKYRN